MIGFQIIMLYNARMDFIQNQRASPRHPPPRAPPPSLKRAPRRPHELVAATGGRPQGRRRLDEARRAADLPPVRLRRRRQDDARAPAGRRYRGRGRFRRLHRQGGPRAPLQGLQGRAHHPQPDLPAAGATEAEEPTFVLNEDSAVARANLVIIDECSMVDEALGRDLLSFGKPVLVLGDPAQLPPVKRRRLFHRGRARRHADRSASPGGGQSDHPHVDDGARRRAARSRRLWRKPRHRARRDRFEGR